MECSHKYRIELNISNRKNRNDEKNEMKWWSKLGILLKDEIIFMWKGCQRMWCAITMQAVHLFDEVLFSQKRPILTIENEFPVFWLLFFPLHYHHHHKFRTSISCAIQKRFFVQLLGENARFWYNNEVTIIRYHQRHCYDLAVVSLNFHLIKEISVMKSKL